MVVFWVLHCLSSDHGFSFVPLLSDGSILTPLAPLVYGRWPLCILYIQPLCSANLDRRTSKTSRCPSMLDVLRSAFVERNTSTPCIPGTKLARLGHIAKRVRACPHYRGRAVSFQRQTAVLSTWQSLPTDYVHDFNFFRISSIQHVYVFSFHNLTPRKRTHTLLQQ